jgi:hypothetical protein
MYVWMASKYEINNYFLVNNFTVLVCSQIRIRISIKTLPIRNTAAPGSDPTDCMMFKTSVIYNRDVQYITDVGASVVCSYRYSLKSHL